MGNFLKKIFRKRQKQTIEESAATEQISQIEEAPAEELPHGASIDRKELLKFTLLNSSEGKVFLIGVTIALIYISWLGAKLIFTPDSAQIMIGMTAVEVLFGRAAGMAFGYQVGLGNITVIPVCMILETILVTLFYPLFVFSWRRLLVIKGLRKVFDRIQYAAETHHDKVRKYGIIGLFAFVWFPFWMTGPMVGCVIGFLMGLPVWINIIVVLAGTYIAIIGWAVLLHTIHEQVAAYSPYAALILLVVIIIIFIIGHLLSKVRQENKKKNSQ